MRYFVIHQGEDVVWDCGEPGGISSYVTAWKFAALWRESDLTNVADIDFYIEDYCPPGGGTVTVRSDISYDLRAKFKIVQPEVTGKCLRARVRGYRVPAEGRVVWAAHYFASTSFNLH